MTLMKTLTIGGNTYEVADAAARTRLDELEPMAATNKEKLDKIELVEAPSSITWDGDTTGLTEVCVSETTYFYKVSDEYPNVVEATFYLSDGQSLSLEFTDTGLGILVGPDSIVVVVAPSGVGVDVGGFSFSEAGTYFIRQDNFYPTKITFLAAGPISISSGGTSANTPEGARANLDVYSKAEVDEKITELTLPSSTSGSTKKFRITVDDSGTITATEV